MPVITLIASVAISEPTVATTVGSTPTGDSTKVAAGSSTTDSAPGIEADAAKHDTTHDTKRKKKNAKQDDSATSDGAVARWILPRELDEISGIALTADGRLLAHGDDRAQISEIDYRRGVIVKQFVVGKPTIRGDLEGIAVANGTVSLLTSNGVLYEFREGANGTRVDYITSDTHLGKECEFEGLAFDPSINSLLLACKNVELENARDEMVIYRWKVDGGRDRLSALTIPLSKVLRTIEAKKLHPSDITVDPNSGNYVVIASIEQALIEITPGGDVVSARKLTGQHDQPESVAITKDKILIIGDEAGRRPAALTLYPWSR